MTSTQGRDPADLDAFRLEVRRFFESEYPVDILEMTALGVELDRDDHLRSQRALRSKGWFAGRWPKEYGGAGWDAVTQYVLDQEMGRAQAPSPVPMGVTYVGPVIYTFGSDDQKKRWLTDILESRTIWAQGYSEPDAGSDLTSLQMAARRQGSRYVLNGTKIWTSDAHWADWIFCLVRTDPGSKGRTGISFICVDMRSAGIRVVPIIGIDGSHHLNRVEFDDVDVPADNLIGQENEGWRFARFLLQNERLSYAHVGRKKAMLAQLKDIASRLSSDDGHFLSSDTRVIHKIAEYEASLDGLEHQVLHVLSTPSSSPALNSALKILVTENHQRLTELFLELAGPYAAANPARTNLAWHVDFPEIPYFAPVATSNYFFQRAQTIYGGSTEIQKNIIAGHLLGRELVG